MWYRFWCRIDLGFDFPQVGFSDTGVPGPHPPIIPFYKRGCQDKCFPGDGKAPEKWSCHPAPVMERGSVMFPVPQIHGAVVTTPFDF